MDKFVTKQLDLFKRIKSTVANIEKLGAAKITKGVVNESEHFYFQEDYISIGEEAYLSQKAYLLDLQEELSAGKSTPSPNPSSLRALPKIVLPVFSGEYNNWLNFRDLFQSHIIDNDSLSLVEKLHYLKTSLSGEPALLLQNISVTGDNFERAWRFITERYQNLRVLIHAQLTSLTSHPTMKKESAQELKGLVDGTTDSVQALEALKRPVKHWDDWLVFVIAGKLDPKTRMAWESHVGASTEPSTFEELRTFLITRIRALEAVEGSAISSAASSGPPGAPKLERGASLNSYARVRSHATSTSSRNTQRCAICKKEHPLLFCSIFKGMNPRERKQLVTEKHLCYNCLGPHSSTACKSTKRCQVCVGKHHTSLHSNIEQFSAAGSSSLVQVPRASPEVDNGRNSERADTSSKVIHCATTSCSVTESISFILATAELVLESDQGNRMLVRALIDPCSEVSLVEESVAQILKLSKIPDKIPCSLMDPDLTETLTKFWKLEEVPSNSKQLTSEEQACEDHFRKTHSRDASGRYTVFLPFKSSPSLLEYESLEHMKRVPEQEIFSSNYYLPHHGVWRQASATTKLRVVFNASHNSTSGLSLNDLVHTGPNLLPEVFSILLRWRRHAVAFAADIEKMYRQIRVSQADFTYGMACAPFLAIRTLHQLSTDEKEAYPLAAPCLLHDTYVDDVVSGSNTLEEAILLSQQLIALLRAGGFKLRKWVSNNPDLLKNLPADYLASSSNLVCNFDAVSSLLGLFDPLGLLAPVVILAKIFMESLWLLSLNWDDPLPNPQRDF
ncbi:uncharacterized protein LOC143265914 [Megachile rotundata]|uniref:uncharacterized protein LOC143265914 n=1 Tax=Megachile rotundata TaxID=143995 RepID=UPI003FD64376